MRKVVLTGFAFTNPQHVVNGPVYGLDNWIYLAHAGPAHGGDLPRPVRRSRHAAALAGRIRSGRPLAATAAACGCGRTPGCSRRSSGRTQYGHAFDA